MQQYDDEIGDDEIWLEICRAASQRAGISIEHARAILEDAGQTADDNLGVVEALETVLWAVQRSR
jgi:hypothetical protein